MATAAIDERKPLMMDSIDDNANGVGVGGGAGAGAGGDTGSEFFDATPEISLAGKAKLVKAVTAFKLAGSQRSFRDAVSTNDTGSDANYPSRKPYIHKTPDGNSIKLKTAGQAVIAATAFTTKPSEWKGLTPAQAITRLTGTIFDDDAQVPKFLQQPLVTLVSTSDSIQETIESTRTAFESLLYWDAMVSTLAKEKIQVDALRTLALRRMENESETVEWVNKFLQRLWVQMEPGLSESLKVSLGGTLQASKPAFLDDLSLAVFTLGSASPRIETIRSISRTADDVHLMDWDMNFTPVDEDMVSKREKELGDVRQSRVEIVAKLGKGITIPIPIVVADISFKGKLRLGLKFMSKYPYVKTIEYSFLETPQDMVSKREKELGDVRQSRVEIVAKLGKGITIPIPIVVADISFKGKLRLGLKFMSKYPYVKTIEYSFLETPQVDFVLRPLKSLDVMDTPGLQAQLQSIVASSLSGYVEPHKNIFDMEGFMTGSSADTVVGVLKITIYEARNLKNIELAGTSDPYAKVVIGGVDRGRTGVVDASLNPFWGETLYIPIMKSQMEYDPESALKPDELKIALYDYNNTIQDKYMGGTQSLLLSRWVKLLELGAVKRTTTV
ncbi:hypothetical protein HDU76_000166, partial [Blyttiomyces sp. JEL0837]